jgi:hypothetical protein
MQLLDAALIDIPASFSSSWQQISLVDWWLSSQPVLSLEDAATYIINHRFSTRLELV